MQDQMQAENDAGESLQKQQKAKPPSTAEEAAKNAYVNVINLMTDPLFHARLSPRVTHVTHDCGYSYERYPLHESFASRQGQTSDDHRAK